MKILVVEDDRTIAKTLQILLSSYDYTVDVATDGEAGLHLMDAFSYDLLLLDLNLPKVDGIQICQQLRARGNQTPILVLTGQVDEYQSASVLDRSCVNALNAGADDYISKPFNTPELIARVQALLRRGETASQTALAWGQLSIDPSTHTATYGEGLLPLTPKEYAILELFLRNPHRIFSSQAILDYVWSAAESPGEESVRVHIKGVRQKLTESGAPKDLIKTVHRVGYRLNPMYSTELAVQSRPLSSSQVAELKAVNEELRIALQDVQVAKEELQQQNQRLVTIKQDLELRLAERTVELMVADQALQRQHHQWQSLLNYVQDAIAIANDQGYFVDANSSACQLFGVSKADLLHLNIADFTKPEFGLARIWQQFIQQGQIAGEYNLCCPDGTDRTVELTAIAHFISGCHLAIFRDVSDRKQAEQALEQQMSQAQLIAAVAQDIRQSLNLNEVLSRTVKQVRELLSTDRVTIFRFRPDWQGEVIMESVADGWQSLLSTTITDPCFRDHYIEPYRHGRIATLTDIDESAIQPCYANLLRQFQVKASLVVPILQGEALWGLLIAHHCSAPRQWRSAEINLLRQLATQVGIAIQQAELYEQTRQELLERERMQAVLEESEERFRTLSTAIPTGIVQTNADGICLYTNTRWQEMSGLSFTDSLGNGWLQAIHPDDRDAFCAAWEAYLSSEQQVLPATRLLTPDGEIRWIAVQAAVMKSATGEIIGYVSSSEDITNRKYAEQKIREQAALLDIASDAIFVRDLTHRILYWNHGAERLYGWQAAEAIGQLAHELLHSDVTQLPEIMRALIAQGEWRGEIQKFTKAGEKVMVEACWTLVRDETGQPKSILEVDTDITEKKQLEAQFYRVQRLESLGTLASGIAHDLNNTLTPILGIAQLLRFKQVNLDARSQEMLQVLEESAKRGANMVKQILTFTRGGDGKRIPLQIAPLLQEVITVVQQMFPKSIIIRELILDQPLRLVFADPTYLHQVLMNLCVNARDAMPNGGVLTLSAQNYDVDDLFAQSNLEAQVGRYVLVTVSDTGTGIPPEILDRIFEPFFTTKEPSHGTGLGLSTVLGIVKSYGGFLQIASEVGKGSQFKVYLPTTEELSASERRDEEILQGSGEKILIVDDDLAVRQMNQSLLESHHYTTLVASDGIEAIALYAKHHAEIDAVLIDIMMPNLDGITAVRTLRKINSQVKVIAISGLSMHRDAVLAAGASVFLGKPYTLEELLKELHQLIKA